MPASNGIFYTFMFGSLVDWFVLLAARRHGQVTVTVFVAGPQYIFFLLKIVPPVWHIVLQN